MAQVGAGQNGLQAALGGFRRKSVLDLAGREQHLGQFFRGGHLGGDIVAQRVQVDQDRHRQQASQQPTERYHQPSPEIHCRALFI